MDKNYEYKSIVEQREKLDDTIEKLKENEIIKSYLELCSEQEKLVSIEKELRREILILNKRKVLSMDFQSMCYDYDIII